MCVCVWRGRIEVKQTEIGNRIGLQLQCIFAVPVLIVEESRLDYLLFLYFTHIYQLHFRSPACSVCPVCVSASEPVCVCVWTGRKHRPAARIRERYEEKNGCGEMQSEMQKIKKNKNKTKAMIDEP